MKPDCYKCKHRRRLPGSAHSRCAHPKCDEDSQNPFAAILAILSNADDIPSLQAAIDLNIRANPHGIRRGWFHWPFNFDPVWLTNCNGFEE